MTDVCWTKPGFPGELWVFNCDRVITADVFVFWATSFWCEFRLGCPVWHEISELEKSELFWFFPWNIGMVPIFPRPSEHENIGIAMKYQNCFVPFLTVVHLKDVSRRTSDSVRYFPGKNKKHSDFSLVKMGIIPIFPNSDISYDTGPGLPLQTLGWSHSDTK